jgi:hypothetical protein
VSLAALWRQTLTVKNIGNRSTHQKKSWKEPKGERTLEADLPLLKKKGLILE